MPNTTKTAAAVAGELELATMAVMHRIVGALDRGAQIRALVWLRTRLRDDDEAADHARVARYSQGLRDTDDLPF